MSKLNWTNKTETNKNTSPQFLKLQNGSNVMRIITAPFRSERYLINGSYVSVPEGFDLPTDAKKTPHYYIGVFVRKTNETAILDCGPSIYDQLVALSQSEDWGNLECYDVDIVKNPSAGANGYYRVMPKPKKAMTAEELVAQETFDSDILDRFSSPSEAASLEKFHKLTANGTASAAKTLNW